MLRSFLSLWLKYPCPLCQRIAEDTFCEYCRNKLHYQKLSAPDSSWRGTMPLFAWGKYNGELKNAIAKLKYNNNPEIGILLGNWLGRSWQKHPPLPTKIKPLVLPVPMYKAKEQARGYNQAHFIAKGFCQVTNYSLTSKGVSRIRDTKAMFGLDANQRQNNLKGAFALSPSWQRQPPKQPILLVDDIYTQGTTVKEIAKLLSKHRLKTIGAATVAVARG